MSSGQCSLNHSIFGAVEIGLTSARRPADESASIALAIAAAWEMARLSYQMTAG